MLEQDGVAVLMIERAEEIRQRLDARAGERCHHRQEQPMRRDAAQADGLPRVAPQLVDLVDRERAREGVANLGKLCRGHRSLLCWCVWKPQHEGC